MLTLALCHATSISIPDEFDYKRGTTNPPPPKQKQSKRQKYYVLLLVLLRQRHNKVRRFISRRNNKDFRTDGFPPKLGAEEPRTLLPLFCRRRTPDVDSSMVPKTSASNDSSSTSGYTCAASERAREGGREHSKRKKSCKRRVDIIP